MEVFEIEGGKQLSGSIAVSGLKNAATPIIAATLLTREACIIKNVPRIEDVFRMLEIIVSLGAQVSWLDEHTLSITARNLDTATIDQEKIKKMRSSILLLGALSARFEKFNLRQPGGCVIGARPVDAHILALAKMGVIIEAREKELMVTVDDRRATEVVLKEFSVTATENVLMLAASLPGTTTIKIAAAEPHVEDLGHFLQKMGAKIDGLGTHTITVTGNPNLSGAEHTIISDHNEAATFLVLGAATQSSITVTNACAQHLDLVLEKLGEFGVRFEIHENAISVIPTDTLIAVKKVQTLPYPGIPTETQALFAVLATQAHGETLIFDTMFEGRFNYVSELQKMGGIMTVLNPHQLLVKGPTRLRGTEIKSFDLRAGAALIIAALLAQGRTRIEDIYQVDRGYEHIEERLQKIGAQIKRRALSERV